MHDPLASIDLRSARVAFRADTRSAVLAAAAAILSEEGPAALTVRRVALAVNASTKVIYTAFGGKDGLLDALYLHSFAGLERAFREHAGEASPIERLLRMTRAYRAYAFAEPALYSVMFGEPSTAYQAPLASRHQARENFRILRDAVQAALPANRAAEGGAATRLLWSAMHGIVSLELRGLLGEVDGLALFDQAVDAVLRYFDVPEPAAGR